MINGLYIVIKRHSLS